MSSLPPVTTTPTNDFAKALTAALASQLVVNDLMTLPSYKLGDLEAKYTTGGTIGNITVGSHNLILTDANSTLNITPGARPAYPSSADELLDSPIPLDGKAVVVVGGNSSITFDNDTKSPSFGYDIVSGAGTNSITLNNGPTLFQSTTGNDLVKSSGGLDTIFGGSGHDTIYAGGKSSVIAGSAGDQIFSSTLPGGSDTIQAGAGSDTIQLQAGNNSVIGSSGNTIVQGGAGNDTFNGAQATGNESIVGGTGNLTANVSAQGNDTIFGQSGHDITVNINEAAVAGTTDTSTGITTIHFSGGQTIEVKNVNITFNDQTKAHY